MAQDACHESVCQGELKNVSLSFDQDFRNVVATPFKPLCEKDAELNSADAKSLCEKDTKNLVVEPEESSMVNVHALVVDDNLLDRKIVERLVKNASCRVTAVEGGAKALEVLASANNNINLIVTDYCMPEMSGYDLLRHVKESPSLKGIPVVIMSSENVPLRIQSCLDNGAEEFILKPVKIADVKRLKSYVCRSQTNILDHQSASCKKRKLSEEGFKVQSPERGPRIGRVTVA